MKKTVKARVNPPRRVVALGLGLVGGLAVGAAAQFAFVEDAKAGTMLVLDGQTPVLMYRFGEQLAPGVNSKYTTSCYIHPLFAPDGRALTDDFPADHLHHHGVFWTWPVVRTRGVDTQSWMPAVPSLRPHLVRWLKKDVGGGSAVLAVENAWLLDEKETVAKETVTIRIHPADGPGRAVDIEVILEAVGGPLELAGTPEEKKGYGGLCLRGAPLFKGAAMTTDKGPLKEDVTNTVFRWADLSTAELGVAVFVHAGHPDYPIPWLVRNSYAGVINPSWPGLRRVGLDAGAPVALRYRLYIHRGDVASGRVREAFEHYLAAAAHK
jgi:hypothetical protein